MDLSFGTGTSNYADTTHPESGHQFDAKIPGSLGWQPASTYNGGIANVGPFGMNLQPYTYFTFDIWTAYPQDQWDSVWHYDGAAIVGAGDYNVPAYISELQDYTGPWAASTWNTKLRIPLARLGQLGNTSAYKFFIGDNSNNANPFFVDNVGFVAGSYAWIYDGGMAVSWNASANHYNTDPSTPVNGWADASSGASANYQFSPTNLTFLNQTAGLNGLTSPGQSDNLANVIALSVTSQGGMWKVNNANGFDLTPYDTVTFGLLATKSGYAYKVQFYDANGAALGSPINPYAKQAYYGEDNGTGSGGSWTVFCIPLADFGLSSNMVYGFSIQDASGSSTNTIYITAPGFYK